MSIRRLSIVLAAASAAVFTSACSSDSPSPVAPAASTARGSDDGAGSTSGASSSSTRTRLEIALRGTTAFVNAKGKARWTQQSSGRELQVEIENLRPGTQVNFFVGGVQYGATQTVNALGEARINNSTQLGQPVPMSVTGAAVEVKTTAGAVVASGSF